MVVVLPAELTQTQASACLGKLLPGVAAAVAGGADVVVVDASPLTRFDTAALAVLLTCRRAAMGLGKRLYIAGMPEQLVRLATLYGVEVLLCAPLATALPSA